MDVISYISNAVNNFDPLLPPRPTLYRGLHIFEEDEGYNQVINQENGSVILYDERQNYRHYFYKFNEQVYYIVTNGEMSRIYCIRIIELSTNENIAAAG